MQPTRRLQGTAVVISALGDSDAGGCAGFRELKAKAVPDMLSVLSTAASEDVAHFIGGVDLALSTLQALSRRVLDDGSAATCKADSSSSFGVLHLAPLLRRHSPC